MKPHRISAVAAATIAAVSFAACGSSSSNSSTSTSPSAAVSVSEPWVRVTPSTAMTAAAYMTLTSSQANALMSASVPSSVAGMVELHKTTAMKMSETTSGSGTTTTSSSGMIGMHQVSSIPLPAGMGVKLAPGGYHIMLMQLAKPVTAGEHIPITLKFSKGPSVTVQAEARTH